MKKGYTPREIATLLKTAGVIISAQLIKEVIEPESTEEILKKEAIEVSTGEMVEDEILETAIEVETKNVLEKTSGVNLALNTETKEGILEEEALTRAKYTLQSLQKTTVEKAITGGRFEIIPDRPDDEL